jgi:hypothetical protein
MVHICIYVDTNIIGQRNFIYGPHWYIYTWKYYNILQTYAAGPVIYIHADLFLLFTNVLKLTQRNIKITINI